MKLAARFAVFAAVIASASGWFYLMIWLSAFLSSKTIGTDMMTWGNQTAWGFCSVFGMVFAYNIDRAMACAAAQIKDDRWGDGE